MTVKEAIGMRKKGPGERAGYILEDITELVVIAIIPNVDRNLIIRLITSFIRLNGALIWIACKYICL